MVAVDLGSICGPNLVTWIWFLFLCVVPHGHCGSSKQLWTPSDCPVHHCSVHHCCLEIAVAYVCFLARCAPAFVEFVFDST